MKRYHLLISGRVQGVGFRISTVLKAKILGIKGWVKNTRSGKVEIIAEGEDEKIAKFLKWCRKGPAPFAKVKDVEITEKKYKCEFEEFLIRY